jgi:hypothetical protein
MLHEKYASLLQLLRVSPLAGSLLIPRLSDQDPWAQLRSPMDMMVHGWASSLFQASQQ